MMAVDLARCVVVTRPWENQGIVEVTITERALAASMGHLSRLAQHLWLDVSDVEGAWRVISEAILEATDSATPLPHHLELSAEGELEPIKRPRNPDR